MRKILLLIAAAMAFVPLFFAPSAGAAELKLFGGGHFQASGQALVEAFTKKTGIAASYTPGNTGAGGMAKILAAGEVIDVVVLNSDDMKMQAEAGLIKRDSVVMFARNRLGLAVRKGAPKPDISTAEKVRAALLAATTVGMQAPDPERPNRGINVVEVLTKLGILNEIKSKAFTINDPSTALVGRKADISFWAYPELLERKDVDVLGPVPLELGGLEEQSVGILARNQNDADAKAFIRFLTSRDGEAVWTKTGLDPMAKR